MARSFHIEEDECIGCESCVGVCPGAFAMDEASGKARVINLDGGSEEEIQEAMDTCPAQCIHWDK